MRRYILHGTLDRSATPLSDACAQFLALAPDLCDDVGALCSHPQLLRIFTDAPINDKERQACLASLEQMSGLAQGIPVNEFLGRLTLIANSSIDMHQRKEPVTMRLMTVEACKGREFTFVAVPFVERGRFPASASHQEAYRERNMLYVALTRARTALWLLESVERPMATGLM